MDNWNANGEYGDMFVVCLRHDKGKIKIATWASDTDKAMEIVCNAEKAPKSAVLWVKKGK